MKKRIILVGKYYIIEPLGILYLLGVAKKLGWEAEVVLVKDFDFDPLYEHVREFRPDLVGVSLWTGYHVQTFAALDEVRRMGVPVAIGGPHATYFWKECLQHADWVVKGEGFRNFRRLLEGELPRGLSFDPERVAEGFPAPDRDVLYNKYPELGESPIKSIFCSVGCPFRCSYCYAPTYNKMYGGFQLTVRPVDEIIAEAKAIQCKWPLQMVYFQDDIFGFDLRWLAEFAEKWPKQVGVPWHCQIRLELTRDERRLDLFKKGGCTGITLAIESGNDFLRRHVLLRPMPDELIVDGIRRVQARGLTLRTEQILAVPFSDLVTDIETLELNSRLNPEMAWTSILAPYGGTSMGAIASSFGFYERNNDDLTDTFFNRSVLRHVEEGWRSVAGIVESLSQGPKDSPLLRLEARASGLHTADLFQMGSPTANSMVETDGPLGSITYLDRESNARYCDQTVMLQRLFNWLAKVPAGHRLAQHIVDLPSEEWTWQVVGKLTAEHLRREGYDDAMARWEYQLAKDIGVATLEELPECIRQNPWYFCFFPSPGDLARRLMKVGAFDATKTSQEQFDLIGTHSRRWLFMRSLYRLTPSRPAIAS